MDQLLRQVLTELRGAWRFRWIAMACAWLVAGIGTAVVLLMPDAYEARAQVYVDSNDPLMSVQRGLGNDAQLKVLYVRRLLLSRPNLEAVARQTDLDLRAPTPQALQALISGLQEKIQVSAAGSSGFEANLYSIIYRDHNRDIAERVVQVLLNSFQQQSLEGDLKDDLQALAFLDNQMGEYRRRLEDAENRVADFRRRNAGLTPGSGEGFFGRLATMQEQLRQVRADLRIALEKRAALSAQFGSSESAPAQNESGATSLVELENQVLQTEKQLDELRLKYTDEHPSVLSTRETLAALQARLERRREELGPLLGTGAGGAVVENVRIALTQAEIEVTELRGRERDLEQRVAELQEKVDIAPQLEAELAGLNRDHDVLRNQYESLLSRKEQLSFDIDRKRQGRQMEFRIIEPPLAPERPVAPDRYRLLLLVLVASLAGGGGVAFLLHQMRPVFVSGDAIYQDLQIPVLGTVSMAWTQRAVWRRRRAEFVFAVGMAVLMSAFGLAFMVLPRLAALAQRIVPL